MSFPELTELGHRLPEEFRAQRYGVKYHGVGLCDEFPCIYYPEDVIAGAFDYVLEPGMVLAIEPEPDEGPIVAAAQSFAFLEGIASGL